MNNNLITLECPGCKANLEIDLDNMIAYCPYCGKKLSYNFEGLSDVLTAKERTKQIKDINQYDLERIKLEHKELRKDDFHRHFLKKILPIIILLSIWLITAILLLLIEIFLP